MESFTPIPHWSQGKYMDPRALILLLREQYGPKNFSIRLQRDQYILSVGNGRLRSSSLTDQQIDRCRRPIY
ncbi:hypothetical protein BDV18DRAFT_143073 [Aspergillus unguis]